MGKKPKLWKQIKHHQDYLGKEKLAHTPSIAKNSENLAEEDDKFLKIVKNITSKGFVRSNYEEKLVDLSDIRLNLKTKN